MSITSLPRNGSIVVASPNVTPSLAASADGTGLWDGGPPDNFPLAYWSVTPVDGIYQVTATCTAYVPDGYHEWAHAGLILTDVSGSNGYYAFEVFETGADTWAKFNVGADDSSFTHGWYGTYVRSISDPNTTPLLMRMTLDTGAATLLCEYSQTGGASWTTVDTVDVAGWMTLFSPTIAGVYSRNYWTSGSPPGVTATFQLDAGLFAPDIIVPAAPDRQYRPISSAETDTDDACSVRVVRDLSDAINNLKLRVQCPKLLSELWPAISSVRIVVDGSVSTNEQVVLPPVGPFIVAQGYEYILWTIQHQLLTGSGVTWRLYVANALYRGNDDPFDGFASGYEVSQIVSSTPDPAGSWSITSQRTALKYVRNLDNRIYLLLTAEPADAGSSVEFRAIDAYAVP